MVENLLKDRARQMRREPTEAERRMWRLLRDRRLGGFKFRRQEQLGRYIVDFVCFEQKLIVELDGSQHAESAYDAERDAWLRSRDFIVLRFWNNEVFENPAWRSACGSDEARARMAGVVQWPGMGVSPLTRSASPSRPPPPGGRWMAGMGVSPLTRSASPTRPPPQGER